jgi:carbamate kinase
MKQSPVVPADSQLVRLIVALGGNALVLRGEPADIETQRANILMAVSAIAQLARSHQVVVTHGNGPQVGLLALQSEMLAGVNPYPLDVLGAESEGMIGYLLEQELANHLPGRPIATLLTQVVVDAEDDAFGNPSKPIGPVYDRDVAERLASQRGWSIAPDGERYRRVVPSPEPRAVVELGALRLLVEAGVLVVCVGGGGIPVVIDAESRLHGVEAVIDKDLTAALLATELEAQALLMLTDVANVEADWHTTRARALTDTTSTELRSLTFAPGSMGPKVEAACRFVEQTGGVAAIGALRDATRLLSGECGTRVTAGQSGPESGSSEMGGGV